MELAPIAIGGLFLLFLLLLPVMVLLHELGHAIPLMLMTKQRVTLYVGSFGDEQYSFRVRLGYLTLWLRYNPWHWRGGLCVTAKANLSMWQRGIYLVCGSLCSLLISTLLLYFVFAYDMHGLLKATGVVAAFIGVADAAWNLTPRKIATRAGKTLYSDGYQLMQLRKTSDFLKEFTRGNELFKNKAYDKAKGIYEGLMKTAGKNEGVYKMLNQCYLFLKEYDTAFALQKEIERTFSLTANDYYNMGLTCLFLHKEERHNYFRKALSIEPNHLLTLNAVGYGLNQQGKFAEALPLFDKAIEGMPQSAHAYNNRGHAKIALGEQEAGLQDIEYSLTLDAENAYAYRNLGIYHLAKGDKETARPLLQKAKEMEKDVDLIDELIEKAR